MKRFWTILVLVWAIAEAAFAYDEYYAQVIKIYDENDVTKLEDAGVEILRRRGDILLCYVPLDSLNGSVSEILNKKDGMSRIKSAKRDGNDRHRNRGNLTVPTLDQSVKFFDASHILTGEGFDRSYTGKGVVVGICDIGFDPLHPTFLDSEGKSRVKRLTHYSEREGKRYVMEGNEEYMAWQTDDIEKYHATHVGGIIAGNGAGSQYCGIAKDADIVVSTSTLTDVGILAGVEDIIDYAKEAGKPAVINLSVGNYVGAHDGSSLSTQYLDMCAEEDAIIVVSSGNEGNHLNTLSHTFTESNNKISFKLGSKDWNQTEMYGETDLWSGSAQPFTVEINIYDESTRQIIHSYPELNLSDDEEVLQKWDMNNPDIPGLAFDGIMSAIGGVDRENGRYRVILSYDFYSKELVEGKSWAKYIIEIAVKGNPGQELEVFADGTYTRLVAGSGGPAPDSSKSISDLACGENVVSVGMYGNRESWPVTSRGETMEMSTGYSPFRTVVHSSYGILRDGRVLPTTVAPGASLVSAYSGPYASEHPEEPFLQVDSPLETQWISEGGTSMSSPYVAGFIATWVEAFPELKSHDVLKVLRTTNRFDIDEPENPRNAMGWFDPVAALKNLISGGGVESLPDNDFTPSGDVEIFSIDGICLYTGDYASRPQLSRGLYIVKSGSPKGRDTRLVRIV